MKNILKLLILLFKNEVFYGYDDVNEAKNMGRKTETITTNFHTINNNKNDKKPKKKSLSSRSNLQKQSIVYQLPNTGESKSKDYDKISGDIKKLELSIKKEVREEIIEEKKEEIIENNRPKNKTYVREQKEEKIVENNNDKGGRKSYFKRRFRGTSEKEN